MLLALDLGMHCGWALFRNGQRLASGTWHLGRDRTRDRGDEFLLRVQSLVQSHGVQAIAHEHIASLHQHVGADAAHLYGGWLMLLAMLAMLARRTAARLVKVMPAEAFAATGIRRAGAREFQNKDERREENKRRVVEAAHARGWPVQDDDEADACFVGLAALTKGACP